MDNKQRSPIKPIGWPGAIVAAFFAASVTALAIWWLWDVAADASDQAQARIEAVRTALAVGAAAAGAIALFLAWRRQGLNERRHVHDEREAEDRHYDAVERRITELFTSAVDQLGSEHAAVRLGGLYSLERVGRDNPTHRQTIVSVICAYLRRPYDLASSDNDVSRKGSDRSEGQRRREELDVRRTAQDIIVRHVRYQPCDEFWSDLDLNLRGALLWSLELDNCVIREASFADARFVGAPASFEEAEFTGKADFRWAVFEDAAEFRSTSFGQDADFSRATLPNANFIGVTFGSAWFIETRFTKKDERKTRPFGLEPPSVFFENARFANQASFAGANFELDTSFVNTDFEGRTSFQDARFHGRVVFAETEFYVPSPLKAERHVYTMKYGDDVLPNDFIVDSEPTHAEDGSS